VTTALAATVAVFVTAFARPCHAQERTVDATNAGDAAPRSHWYGWQTLPLDGVATGLFLAAAADQHDTPLFGVSGVVYFAGAPVVHLAHRRPELALASLGLRLVTPLIGGALGNHYDDCNSATVDRDLKCSTKWAVTGIAIGGLTAALLDDALFAWQPATAASQSSARRAPSVEYFPAVSPLFGGILASWQVQL
jgi:hypothetical protein